MKALLLFALAAASSAQALPCQMDPKFYRASCDDPEMQAATQAYLQCAAQHGAGVAPGYGCVPGGPTQAKGPDCSQTEKCRFPASLRDAPMDEYNAAWEQYKQCVSAQPKSCLVPSFPGHAPLKGTPPTPAQPATPATPVAPVKTSRAAGPQYPGYGRFGQALVNAGGGNQNSGQNKGADSGQRSAPQPAAPKAAPPQPAAPPPASQGNFQPVLNQQSAAPAFAPLSSPLSGNARTQEWLKKKRQHKPQIQPAPQKDDTGGPTNQNP